MSWSLSVLTSLQQAALSDDSSRQLKFSVFKITFLRYSPAAVIYISTLSMSDTPFDVLLGKRFD